MFIVCLHQVLKLAIYIMYRFYYTLKEKEDYAHYIGHKFYYIPLCGNCNENDEIFK